MMEQVKKKKKITLNSIGLIVLVLMAAAYCYLWQARTGVEAETAVLGSDIAKTQVQIKALEETAVDNLETELAAVKAELAAVQAGFPNALDRNEVVDYLLDVAGNYGISILPLQSFGWTAEKIGQNYQVLKISVNAQGSLKQVEDFMRGLHAGRYPTLVISGCKVTRDNISYPGFPGEDMKVTVDMEIGIYTIARQSGEGN